MINEYDIQSSKNEIIRKLSAFVKLNLRFLKDKVLLVAPNYPIQY